MYIVICISILLLLSLSTRSLYNQQTIEHLPDYFICVCFIYVRKVFSFRFFALRKNLKKKFFFSFFRFTCKYIKSLIIFFTINKNIIKFKNLIQGMINKIFVFELLIWH